LGSQQPDRYFG